jgi:hypothetical protein
MGSQKKQAKDELRKIVQRSKVKIYSFFHFNSFQSQLSKKIFSKNTLRPNFP